jgi:spoIIIJ-associated protein
MLKEAIAIGKDIEEAKENTRAALGATLADVVNFEVIEIGSRGIFGIIGVKPAKVKAWIELPDLKENKPRQEKGEGKKNRRKNRPENKGEKKPREQAPKEPKAEKPVSVVIPEAEIKMERREVNPGEDLSFDFVKTLINGMELNAEAELYSCDDGTRRIAITGEEASMLIGHHGDTLDALQYLANLVSTRKNINGERDKSRVTIDIGGYRAKREETLRALARRMAAKALKNRRSVMLEPMSAYERRIIHSEIQGIEGVSTNSIGSDNNRKIVIYLTDKKPVEIFKDEEELDTVAERDTVVSADAMTEAVPAEEPEAAIED